MKSLNLSLVVKGNSIQIVHNGKEIVKSIHIFNPSEIDSKKEWMQKKIDNYNLTGKL